MKMWIIAIILDEKSTHVLHGDIEGGLRVLQTMDEGVERELWMDGRQRLQVENGKVTGHEPRGTFLPGQWFLPTNEAVRGALRLLRLLPGGEKEGF